ncbi:N-terminal domain of NEFA-interacting nuclear protein NIP30-domain-containing protein [Phanerochaete sordida]|uniref:N-terminal domain of NEFA-interacting nuclear protein NIP30-domain-containing protein n=1 Tax=Phanerochaete sordida TaxID=48140 RepID=A0A9P3G053_9APHY|nr:N-terminal domain of NEFA-interacting nuclear protein NIP30-domain-containing protein [Phanerochaete sordida]
MEEAIPSLSTVGVGSRFVSQDDLEAAKAKRQEQWKAAYARLGQEPPPEPKEDVFDGRSLAEKLAANRAAKQEEWEERNKLGNQFRALEEDEVLFLDSILEKQREEERLRKETEGEELKNFREAVAARENAAKPPPVVADATPPSKPKPKPAPSVAKKDTKKSLKGVLVKKKPAKPSVTAASTAASTEKGEKSATGSKDQRHAERSPGREDDDLPQAKRRKVSEPEQ